MAHSLSEIQAPVKNELKQFETHFKSAMKSSVPLLGKITNYILRRKGKQIRPLFVFLTAGLVGEIKTETYHAASLVELLHTATLVHDDVVDDSQERRGFYSLQALWGKKIAVLVGDYLLSKGLLLALDHKAYHLLHILSEAVREMSEGELLQIQKARKLDITEDIYFEVIRQKTASLIAAACSAGAASVSKDEDVIAQAKLMGEKIGIAFQIKDDLLDFGDEDIGKPLGIDIKEKKMTLPLIHALKETNGKQRKKIIKLIKKGGDDPKNIETVVNFVRNSGGLKYAKAKMYDYLEEARVILKSFPKSDFQDSLDALMDFVTERKK